MGESAGVRFDVFWRVALVQLVAVALLSVLLAALLSDGFFEDWGWLAGPAAWLLCAWITARVVGLGGAARAGRCGSWPGVVSAIAVIFGQHWLGALVAVGLFAAWCARRHARGNGLDLGIEGRVALVMGASRGLGQAIAAALAGEGARVAIASRSAEKLEEAAAAIDGEATAFVADASDLDRVAALPGEVAEALGPIEILITNTGGPPLGGALDHELDGLGSAPTARSVLAPRVLAGAVVPGMRERGWGRIVNVGSSSTREPIPGLNLSNAHRMAAVGFLKTLSREVAADGITVNTVATGRFATAATRRQRRLDRGRRRGRESEVPAARLGRPEEYGDLVAFLCSERAAYITGTVIPIDGGLLRSAF